jgi:signal transduction histidine kinase
MKKNILVFYLLIVLLLVSTSYMGWRLADEKILLLEAMFCLAVVTGSLAFVWKFYDAPTEIKPASSESNSLNIPMSLTERNLLLTALSHDMKTPLTRAILKLNLLPETKETQSILKDLNEINMIIRSTLDFSQSPNQIAKVPIELISLLEMMIEQYSYHQDFALRLDTTLSTVDIYAEIHLFKRMIQNIIDNAMKYSTRCHIKVADLDHNYVVITFSDNGPGVPSGMLSKLTEPYFRVDPSRSKDTGGIGLGLAIVKKITEIHHGKIKCRNLKEGFQVQLIFPIITSE